MALETARAWAQASRLPSQSYIALPLLLGQLIAWSQTGQWDWTIFALVQAFGVFDQLYIVYANDYADQETDRDNETATIFSGGSRVLVEGTITPRALGRAAALMAALALATGVALLVGFGRVAALPLMALGIALLWAYSYPPLRLSYRGGGELLQMLGVGLVLPLVAYEAQAGALASFPWPLLAALLPMNLATGMCTALPDEPSDRRADKRTVAVTLGGATARGLIIALNLAGVAAFWFVGHASVAALDLSRASLVATPALASALMIPLVTRARPGTHAILAFVFLGILANLALTAAMILDLSPWWW